MYEESEATYADLPGGSLFSLGLTVRPGHYGTQKMAVPGPHWPVMNEDMFMAVQADYWGDPDFSTFCLGSDKPGNVVNCELLSGE